MRARRFTRADRLLIRVGFRAPGWAVLLLAGMCAAAASSLLVPASLGTVVNTVITHRDATPATVRLAAILLAGALGSLAAGFAGPSILARSTAWLGRRLFGHVISLGMRGQADFPPGDMTSRLLDNIPAATDAALSALEIAMSLVTSLGAVAALWLTDWLLGVVFLVAAGPAVMMTRSSMRGAQDIFLRYQRAQGRIASGLSEALAGIRTIQSSGTTGLEVGRILRPLPELAAAGAAMWGVWRRVTWRASLCFALMELAVLATAGWEVAAGRLSPGGWLAAAGYTTLALGVFGSIDAIMGIAHSRAAAVRVTEVLETPPAGPGNGTARLGAGGGDLTFRHVTVRSGARRILDGLDLHIPAGVTVAVVGRSGTGKTTLAALVGRLHRSGRRRRPARWDARFLSPARGAAPWRRVRVRRAGLPGEDRGGRHRLRIAARGQGRHRAGRPVGARARFHRAAPRRIRHAHGPGAVVRWGAAAARYREGLPARGARTRARRRDLEPRHGDRSTGQRGDSGTACSPDYAHRGSPGWYRRPRGRCHLAR